MRYISDFEATDCSAVNKRLHWFLRDFDFEPSKEVNVTWPSG